MGDISLLEIPRQDVGTMTRLCISKRLQRREKGEKKKMNDLRMNLKNLLKRMVEMPLLWPW
jgi:hypothetical protein